MAQSNTCMNVEEYCPILLSTKKFFFFKKKSFLDVHILLSVSRHKISELKNNNNKNQYLYFVE